MRGEPVLAFSIWHAGGMTAASRLHVHARLHATQAAIGRVAALSPVQHGCLELSRAHRGGRSRWIVDIAIGGASRPAIIRAAVAVAGRHAAAVSGGPFAIVAHGEVAAALVDTKLPLFANAVEACRWVDARADGAAMQ